MTDELLWYGGPVDSCEYVGTGVYGKSLYLLLNVAVKIKLL